MSCVLSLPATALLTPKNGCSIFYTCHLKRAVDMADQTQTLDAKQKQRATRSKSPKKHISPWPARTLKHKELKGLLTEIPKDLG